MLLAWLNVSDNGTSRARATTLQTQLDPPTVHPGPVDAPLD
jgi:hypothetical protein